jgi:hypothetical protein
MLKSDLLRLLQQEIRRHDFDFFVDEPPSMAQGRRSVVVSGCSLFGMHWSHLRQDNLPIIVFRNKNDAHPVHPDALQAGEDCVLP